MSMFTINTMLAYVAACLLVVVSPGPDNILAVSRGLSQGRAAAALTSIGAGLGIMFHTLAATVGLSLIIQNSPGAFWVVKAVGALYLLWLGYKALASGNLISFAPTAKLSLSRVFLTGVMSNVLNPKPGLFVLAFLPQFVDAARGSVQIQMLVYGAIFAVLTALIFTAMGSFASKLAGWLSSRPRVIKGMNVGAGLTFIAAGLSVLTLKNRA
ncbi:LysE family translocator [Variovorax sp. OK605]|jgi:threonine/homoserine/homoserine lactone efflux protein|uniref:LysE family translocator n=1 Tax=Variovorax sp. OK605 TaxID=1855317 RepID=UPI00210B0CDA|nr:LysE family translocator [Variovorax sp. OK605]